MKIQKLRFKNLNSLAGEWQIDFTHPEYINNGIFAITGATGAGKSTILDAISLALYGRTPRLNKITKSENEIMSRHTGECFAEVIFISEKGQFCCFWSQRRARQKANGALQPPKHEIADLKTNQILATKTKEVATKIEYYSGMDFDRFTRSMLLAQGGFSAFLQANANERAPILEQITGSEIYSQISIQVHTRTTTERDKLNLLKAKFAGIQLLDSTEEQTLITKLDAQQISQQQIKQARQTQQEKIHWLQQGEQLNHEFNQLTEQQSKLTQQILDFKPQQEKLSKAQQAQKLTADYQLLTQLKTVQKEQQDKLQSDQDKQPEQLIQTQQAENQYQVAISGLEQQKQAYQQILPVLKKVRLLDLKIAEKEPIYQQIKKEIKLTETNLIENKNNIINNEKSQDQNQQQLEEVQTYLENAQSDESLNENLPQISNQFKLLIEIQTQQQKNQDLEEKQQIELEKAEQQQVTSELAEKKVTLEETQEQLVKLESLLPDINDLNEQKHQLKDLLALFERKKQNKSQEAPLLEQQKQLENNLQNQLEKITLQQALCNAYEQESLLLAKVQTFEQARQQLQKDQACPLCGAIEHPYIDGSIPFDNKIAIKLTETKEQLNQAQKIAQDLTIEIAKNKQNIQQNQQEKIEITQALSTKDLTNTLHKTDLEQINQKIEKYKESEKEITQKRELLNQVTKAYHQLEKQNQAALYQKESLLEKHKNLKKQQGELVLKAVNENNKLQQLIQTYGNFNLIPSQFNTIQQSLTIRKKQWSNQQKKQQILTKEQESLILDLQHQQKEQSHYQQRLTEKQAQFKTLEKQLKTLTQQRQELFKNQDPEQIDNEFTTKIAILEKQLENTRQNQQQQQQLLDKIKQNIKYINQLITENKLKIEQQQSYFNQQYLKQNFIDEADYLNACLNEIELTQLTTQANQLQQQQNQLKTRLEDKQQQLIKHDKKQLSQQPLDELNTALTDLNQQYQTLTESIGAIKQQLTLNNENKHNQQQQIAELEVQKAEYHQWLNLHQLIGSADGKKFRNFAQGLTFEIMVNLANQQLQKMSDRYLLVRDNQHPLDLNVIDSYQAGEIRSTKNVSGGESFIISLALALGLSQMASQNSRIDSLFLDEGFGTLDEESLDVALETLNGLQQEGKLIGVISHVGSLKDRISTQIKVISKNNGKSILQGVGVE